VEAAQTAHGTRTHWQQMTDIYKVLIHLPFKNSRYQCECQWKCKHRRAYIGLPKITATCVGWHWTFDKTLKCAVIKKLAKNYKTLPLGTAVHLVQITDHIQNWQWQRSGAASRNRRFFNVEKRSVSECLCSLLELLVCAFFHALKFVMELIFLIAISSLTHLLTC